MQSKLKGKQYPDPITNHFSTIQLGKLRGALDAASARYHQWVIKRITGAAYWLDNHRSAQPLMQLVVVGQWYIWGDHLYTFQFHSLMMFLLSSELSRTEALDLDRLRLSYFSLDLLFSWDLEWSLFFLRCFLSFLSPLRSRRSRLLLSNQSSLSDLFLVRYSGCSRYICWKSSFLKLLERGLTCMQLQQPPRLQLPSMYCLHLALRKSVTGEKIALIFLPWKKRPLMLLRAFSEYSSSLYLTQTLPTMWSPRLSTTIMSSISPYWLISRKTSSKNCSNLGGVEITWRVPSLRLTR